jgi:molecular chaperone GrpE
MSEHDYEAESLSCQGLEGDSDDIEIIEVVGYEPEQDVTPDPSSEAQNQEELEEYVLDLDQVVQESEEPPAPREIVTAPPPVVEPEVRVDRLKRLQADFENYKKRVDRERLDLEKHATNRVITRLLPVLDNFERAIGSLPSEQGEALMDGVTLIFRQLLDELRKEGLTAIESVGEPFDPNVHDAVETESAPGHPAYVVVEELQRGYQLHGRLLRPALVKVAVAETGDGE